MTNRDVYKKIIIDPLFAVPKYRQLADAIVESVKDGSFSEGLLMPSINEMSDELGISRPTVHKAYRYLQRIKIMDSVPGKCYFIAGKNSRASLHVALFFNKLSAHKKIIYDAFVQEMGSEVAIDFSIYNNDFALFKTLLESKSGHFTHFVIIPHFLDCADRAAAIINTIPKHKLILLDKKLKGITGEFGAVYEHFEQDIYNALVQAGELLDKYKTIKIVFPPKSYFPQEILTGFELFCNQFQFASVKVTDLSEDETKPGDLYVTLIETDLVELVERITNSELRLGIDVGILSYNETPIKRIIRDGIATISTDFYKMGQEAAKLILTNSRAQVQVPFSLIRRPSV
jgi:DNA-binding transcriptional regulator YhcF (GntR family)